MRKTQSQVRSRYDDSGLKRIGAADRHTLKSLTLDRHHRALANGTNRIESCFDFTELDPIAAAFDLRVRSAEQINQVIRADNCQVAGFIDAPETRVYEKRRSCFFRIPPVARTQSGTTNVELPAFPRRHRLER